MSVLGNLLNRIFHRTAQPADAAQATPQAQQTSAQTSQQGGTGATDVRGPASAGAGQATSPPVDVEQILDGMAKQNSQKLNWRTSIVDLMKLVGMDSSLDARKELAKELNYTGQLDGSADMNLWLHKQVMARIAQNGGKVPKDLLH